MPNWTGIARVAGVAGVVAAGATVGVVAEKAMVGKRFRRDSEADEPFGTLRGREIDVFANDGTRLHVEIDEPANQRDNLTVIFCHGYALNQDSFHYQRRDLRSLGRLVFWDQRSHGRSQRGHKSTSNIDQLGADLAAVVDAVAPTGPVVLVGHSMGGMTVMAYADQRPEEFGARIAGVALLATSAAGLVGVPLGLPDAASKLVTRSAPGFAESLARNKELIERSRRVSSDLSLLLTNRYSFGSKVSPTLTQFVAEMLNATPIDVVAEFMPAFTAHDKRSALGALNRVETLVMVGDSDMLTPGEHSLAILHRVPGAEYIVLPDTGHMLLLERYPEVNQHLRELVGRVRRNAAVSSPGTAAG